MNINREEEKENIKTLLEILPFENMKIIKKVEGWQEGVKKSGEILLKNKYIKEDYINECIDIINQKGMYILIGKNIILPHGSIKKNTLKTGMSFLKLENEVLFPENVYIKYIVMLATLDKKEHINDFLQLKKIIDETDFEIKVKIWKKIFLNIGDLMGIGNIKVIIGNTLIKSNFYYRFSRRFAPQNDKGEAFLNIIIK